MARKVAYAEPFDEGHVIELWDSERSRDSCAQGTLNQVKRQVELLGVTKEIVRRAEAGQSLDSPKVKELIEKRDALEIEGLLPRSTCGAGKMGELTPGTRVEIIEPSDECGESMTKVRVLQGNATDLVGCILAEDVASAEN